MATITEDLVRKCAEHNECEIFSLEELSLHQRDIKKIEHLDRWCRDLKILYLHSNLISKIENLSRLKKLEYVNFTLNNITRIENLEGCESLRKLDLTVNFIGELTSIESLQDNYNLEELYLTGNPCSEFEGYRYYVIHTLPQLKMLDGEKIKKSERIKAMQYYHKVRGEILEQQRNYLRNTAKKNDNIETKLQKHETTRNEDDDEKFWKQKTKFTPQSRIEIYEHMKKSRKETEKQTIQKQPRRLVLDDGRILNVNEAKLNFDLHDDEENNCFLLNLAVYKYLDTSLIEADVQPNYICVKVKGKYFQLLLPQEVHPDMSTCQRSQTTGHLLITMPKASEIITKRTKENQQQQRSKTKEIGNKKNSSSTTCNQVNSTDVSANMPGKTLESIKFNSETPMLNSSNMTFIDDPSVPPLI